MFHSRLDPIARVLSLLAAGVLAIGLSGCEVPGAKGGVAVLDLDAVATATGRDAAINARVQAFAKEQEDKLQALKRDLETQVSDASAKLGDAASAADRQHLTELVATARSQFTRELGQARESAQQLRQQLVREFAVEVQPVAARVARQRGLQVVMVKQPSLIAVAPEVDITQAVIDSLKDEGARITPALPEGGN